MKSFFDEFFSVDGFGKMKLFDFPFDTDVKEDENDGENHTYFHKVTDKYDELGQRISHVEKEVKDGKVLKDIKEEPKLQVVKNSDICNCVTTPSDEIKKLKEGYADELKHLKEDYSALAKDYDELSSKFDKIEEMYNNVKKENDAFKLGLRNLLDLEK